MGGMTRTNKNTVVQIALIIIFRSAMTVTGSLYQLPILPTIEQLYGS
jgi:hypothetical protein